MAGYNTQGAQGAFDALRQAVHPDDGDDRLAAHTLSGHHPVSDAMHAIHASRLDDHDARLDKLEGHSEPDAEPDSDTDG